MVATMSVYCKEIVYPMIMILFIVMGSLYLSYGRAEGPWYRVVYLDGRDPFSSPAKYVEAIADDNERGSTVYLKSNSAKQALIHTGAILLDPQGMPLCLNQY